MEENKIAEKIKSFDWSKVFKDGASKESSKRVAGMAGFGIFLIMGILSGFNWYEMNNDLILGGLAVCGGLLGISTFKKEA
jgi:hypothetical protein